MYKIYAPEEVLAAVGFAHPIKGYPDYDYKKGFNDGLNWFQVQLAKYSREVKLNGSKRHPKEFVIRLLLKSIAKRACALILIIVSSVQLQIVW